MTDKQLIAMGKEEKPIRKRVLFKEYAVSYCNLGMANRDSKTMRKELPAIAKRASHWVMKHILKKTRMPGKFPEHQQPFITVIIYAGIAEEIDGRKTFTYPSPTADYKLEEV